VRCVATLPRTSPATAVAVKRQAATRRKREFRSAIEGVPAAAVGFAVRIGWNRIPTLREPGYARRGAAIEVSVFVSATVQPTIWSELNQVLVAGVELNVMAGKP